MALGAKGGNGASTKTRSGGGKEVRLQFLLKFGFLCHMEEKPGEETFSEADPMISKLLP